MEIKVLDSSIFNRIAAGEVVDRPSSIVKELIENSIDAGATAISIEVENGGIDKIRVTDDGKGISSEQLKVAFLPHATSKVSSLSDLERICTLGFRGEALPSIASVSYVSMMSRTNSSELGSIIVIQNGNIIDQGEKGCPYGTTVTVEKLFNNIPARAKFLKKASVEEAEISELVQKLILANPDLSIKYIANDKKVYHSAGDGIESAIYTVYGKEFLNNMEFVHSTMSEMVLKGYVNKPSFSKHNRSYQTLVVNNRYVINSDISYYIYNCYQNYLMKRQYPAFVLYLEIPLDMVDVNVHPNKMEVKFANYQLVKTLVTKTVMDYIQNAVLMPKEISTQDEVLQSYPKSDNKKRDDIFDVAKIIPSHNSINKGNDMILKENGSFFNIFKNPISHSFDKTERDSTYKELFGNNEKSDNDNNVSKQNNKFANPNSIQSRELSATKDELSNETYLNNFKQEKFDISESYKLIGKLFNTYIILEYNSDAYYIDQHAAHEKILYDKMIEEFNSGKMIVQDMMVPYLFDVNYADNEILLEKIEDLNKCGFTINKLSGLSYSLSALPLLCVGIDLQEFVSQILTSINNKYKKTDFIKEVIMQSACKAAVKGEMDLSKDEIIILLNAMVENRIDLFCPHGRPIVVKISKAEMEKWFKRIV